LKGKWDIDEIWDHQVGERVVIYFVAVGRDGEREYKGSEGFALPQI